MADMKLGEGSGGRVGSRLDVIRVHCVKFWNKEIFFFKRRELYLVQTYQNHN